MEKEIKLSFFKRLKMSLLDFDKYFIIAGEGVGRAMLYLVKLMLLFSLVMTSAFVIKIAQLMDQATAYVKEQIPNFYFQNDQFFVESDSNVTIENYQYINAKIVLSNAETYNEEELKNFDGMAVALLKNKIILKQENSTSIITRTYKEINEIYNINELNKEKVIDYFRGENAYTVLANIFAIIFIVVFITYFITVILDIIALSLLGYIISRVIRIPLKYSAIYSISVSAITLSIIINLIYIIINLFTGFIIPYFQAMYTLISYICLIAALWIIKSELIKKKIQIQLAILNKEKEKKAEEQKEEEQEKKEEPKDEKKEDLKGKVEDKINGNKDKPEPQANIK